MTQGREDNASGREGKRTAARDARMTTEAAGKGNGEADGNGGGGGGGGGGSSGFSGSYLFLDGEKYSMQNEGQATILQKGDEVFYNRAQVVNRDISCAVLREFAHVKARELSGAYGDEEQKKARRRNKHNCTALKMSASRSERSPLAKDILELSYPQAFADFGVERPPPTTTTSEAGGTGKDATEAGEKKKEGKEEEEEKELTETDLHMPKLVICEALAASGLRAIRYARELECAARIIANDSDASAVEAIRRNVEYNGVQDRIVAHQDDARMLLLRHERCFDVVDIDPYGSPSTFLEAAVQAVNEGGLLCATATDMAVLCGGSGEACYAKYGSYPVKGKYCHEYAVRTLLHAVEAAANKYKRHIVPVLSLSIDFYARVFVRIYTSPSAVKLSASKMSYVYQSTACDSFYLQPVARVTQKNGSVKHMPGYAPVVPTTCPETGKGFYMGGPIWSDPIHDMRWVRNILKDIQRNKERYPGYVKVHSCIVAASEELVDVPLYVTLHAMASTLKCEPPNVTLFRSALINAGYRVSISHASALGVKTDAPMEVIWDIMRCWVKEHPIKNSEKYANTPGAAILAKEPKVKANWSRVAGSVSSAKERNIPRFVPNPTDNWGPMAKAGSRHNEADRGKTKKQRIAEHDSKAV